ncbi:AAA family ATPase [Azospirillum sp.]|uniref:AAA family ATPase n=1 Tax=Azospirillum sp. TaxID=34012 RepID=UPI002D423C44|nr:AAA family ATPase [Azospirillum sp.]HYF89778.1 AAA family ATPase [Azospirillum sp.]
MMARNPSLRFRELTVSNFRGIGDRLPIDLSARLTVIHAANGTGKTSLCQAVEWLMTGKAGELTYEDLRYRLRPGAEPHVEASVLLDGEPWRLRRTRTGCRFGREGETPRSHPDTRLLEMLAPAAVEDSNKAPQTANAVRTTWLRGTHFLDATNLAVLLDSDKDSKKRREEIFADILGIRRLLDTEDGIARYLKPMRRATNRLSERITEKEIDLAAIPEDGAAVDVAERELAAALAQLPPMSPSLSEKTFEERLAEAISLHSHEDAKVGQQKVALLYVELEWNRAQRANETSPAVQTRLERCKAIITRRTERLRTMRAEIERFRMQVEAERKRADDARHLVAGIRNAWNAVAHDALARWGASLSVRSMAELLPEALWTDSQHAECRAALRWVEEQRADQVRRRVVVEALKSRLAGLPVPSSEQLAAAEANLSECERIAREAAHEYEMAAGPLQRLQAAGQATLAALGEDERSCPLCGHGWSTAQALRTALSATLTSVPPLVQRLEENRRKADEAAVAARQRLHGIQSQRRLYDQTLEDLVRESEPFNRLAEYAAALGLPTDEKEWAEAVPTALARLDLAGAVGRLLDMLKRSQSLIPGELPEAQPLETAVELISHALQEVATQAQGLAANRIQWTGRIEKTADRLSGRLAHLREYQRELDAQEAGLRKEWRTFKEAWERLSEDEPDQSALHAVRQRVVGNGHRLDAAGLHLEAARKAQSASAAWRQRKSIEAELADLRARRARLDQRMALAQETREALLSHRKAYIQEQLDHLMPVVTTLFARVHANRVFDGIRPGSIEDPLVWLADADDEVFQPGLHFSDGQRQDLALALFLARACRLGGTFFLDEPLVHLDDLNRVAMLDILRVLTLTQENLGLVLTTASRPLVRHIEEKFALLPQETPTGPMLRVIRLEGNPRVGIAAE